MANGMCHIKFVVLPNKYIEIHFIGIEPKPEHPFNMFELVGQTSKMFIVWLRQIGYFLHVYIFVFLGRRDKNHKKMLVN